MKTWYIDRPYRMKSIRNVGPPTCKLEMQNLLGKVNYL
jgi:hypothetical protein